MTNCLTSFLFSKQNPHRVHSTRRTLYVDLRDIVDLERFFDERPPEAGEYGQYEPVEKRRYGCDQEERVPEPKKNENLL